MRAGGTPGEVERARRVLETPARVAPMSSFLGPLAGGALIGLSASNPPRHERPDRRHQRHRRAAPRAEARRGRLARHVPGRAPDRRAARRSPGPRIGRAAPGRGRAHGRGRAARRHRDPVRQRLHERPRRLRVELASRRGPSWPSSRSWAPPRAPSSSCATCCRGERHEAPCDACVRRGRRVRRWGSGSSGMTDAEQGPRLPRRRRPLGPEPRPA